MPEGSQGSPAQPVAWYTLPVDEAFERLQADAAQGLAQAEAVRRLAQFGPNTLAQAHQRSAGAILLTQFRSLIVALLVAATAIAFAMGETMEAAAILVVIVINAAIGFLTDGRNLRAEFQAAGYRYVWNSAGFNTLAPQHLPVLGLFERGHMEYEHDRPGDLGGEPSIKAMTVKAINLLEASTRRRSSGYFLHVESGRIDHAHHAGNAYRALTDTQALDEAIGAAAQMVDLRETLIIVSADHSHVFNIAGYPMRPLQELPYAVNWWSPGYATANQAGNGILDLVYDLNQTTGHVEESTDSNNVPYTILGYHNGPGYRGLPRVDPRTDVFPGFLGVTPTGPSDFAYRQEAAVPLGSETHSGEDVAVYAIGPGAERVRGTVKNTYVFHVMKKALGF